MISEGRHRNAMPVERAIERGPGRRGRVAGLDRLTRKAADDARGLGHLPGDCTHDTDFSTIAECLVCGFLIAADVAHGPEITGAAVLQSCPGPYGRIW